MYFRLKPHAWRIILTTSLVLVGVFFLRNRDVADRLRSSKVQPEGRSDPASTYSRCSDCNLVIISATNTRADHLPTYGYKRNTMPNVDSLARKGTVFDNVFAQSSWTLPSGISIQTSMYPTDHQVMMRVWDFVRSSSDMPEGAKSPSIAHLPGLPDILRSHGYNTFASHGGFDYDAFYGLTSRFNSQVASPSVTDKFSEYGHLANSIPTAINWLEQHQKEKFFIFIQGFDAHCPFGVPTVNLQFTEGLQSSLDFSRCYWTFDFSKPVINDRGEQFPVFTDFAGGKLLETATLTGEDIEYMKALYDGELANVDKMIGRFFDRLRELNLESKTIVVFLSEHGDMFGKHGRFMRGGPLRGTFYDDVLRIPLVIRNPKDPSGGRHVSQLFESVDITPSLLDMLNISAPTTFRGRSFVPVLTDPTLEGRSYVQAVGMYAPPASNEFFNRTSLLSAVRTTQYKAIKESLWPIEVPNEPYQEKRIPSTPPESERIELYDLTVDPEELHNVFDQKAHIAQELLSKNVTVSQQVPPAAQP
jgi:arylsulfatase A-like enzyme